MRWPKIKEYRREWNVLGEIYELKFVRHIEGGLLGECDPETRTMKVRLKQSPKEMFKTVFHELLHAYEFESGKPIGEETVLLIEHWVGEMLNDNY